MYFLHIIVKQIIGKAINLAPLSISLYELAACISDEVGKRKGYNLGFFL